jgi:integrase
MNTQHAISNDYVTPAAPAPVLMPNAVSLDNPAAVIGTVLDYYGLRSMNGRGEYDVTVTGRTYAAALRQFFAWVHATGRHMSKLTHTDIEQYSARFAVKNDNGKPLFAPSTRKVYLTAVRQFYKMLSAELGIMNPAANIKRVRIQTDGTHHHKPFTPAQETALLESARTGDNYVTDKRGTEKKRGENVCRRDFAIVRLLDKLGLRTIEVVRLDVGDLRVDGDGYVLDVRGKGDKPRTMVVPPNTLSALLDYIKNDRKGAKASDPLFVSLDHRPEHNGQRMTTATISRMVKRHAVAVGAYDSRHTAHSLRTTCACRIYTTTGKITDVQLELGHSDPKTSEIYARDAMVEQNRKNSALYLID